MAVKIPVFHGHQGFQQIRRHLIDLDQNTVFEILRVNPADQERLQPHHGNLRTLGPREFSHIIAGESHTHGLGALQSFIELEATGIQVDGVAVDRRSAGAVAHGFATIAQGIEFGQKVSLAELLSDEQLERARIHLGRDGPAFAGEFFLDDSVEVNRESGEHHEADQTEFKGPAQPGAQASGRWFFGGAGGSSTSHGGGLYALYRYSTEALGGLRPADLRP
ncbi:hypothetical protein D3C86_1482330 [compost metagenome]